MAKYSKPMRKTGKKTSGGNGPPQDPPRGTNQKKRKTKFLNSETGLKYSKSRSYSLLNGRMIDTAVSPSITRIEYGLEWFSRAKYIASSNDTQRRMTQGLIDDRARKLLNVMGCTVENSYSPYYDFKEDVGETHAKKGIEHIENVNIVDPEYGRLQPDTVGLSNSFPNKNDPIYQVDDPVPEQNLRNMARRRRAQNNCGLIAAHLLNFNLSTKRGTKLRYFYDSEVVATELTTENN